MPIEHVGKLAQALHDAGIINTDKKLSELLKIQGIGELAHPGSKVSNNAVAWDGYVVITKGLPGGLHELENITKAGGPNR